MKDNQTYREDEGSGTETNSAGNARQPSQVDAPAEGGEGYVGSNTGPKLGMNVVSGKKGSVTSKPVWSMTSSFKGDEKDNSGSEDIQIHPAGTDSTDEYATYKKPQNDEGLVQTYRDSKGAGDAGPGGSDEPDKTGGEFPGGSNQGNPDTQSVPSSSSGDHDMSEMPQTEFTHNHGGGAPLFKR